MTHRRELEAKTAVGRKREASSTIVCVICRTSVNCRNIANVIQNNLQPKTSLSYIETNCLIKVCTTHNNILIVQSGQDSYFGFLGYILASLSKYKAYPEEGSSVFSKALLPTYQTNSFII
jgi:hypothetical protein